MVNAVWTLLRNVDGGGPPATPLGAYADPAYRAAPLPPPLARARAALFGADPDAWMLDYRCRQFLTLLHATELGADVLAFDPRTTYDVAARRGPLVAGVAATPVGHSDPIYLAGDLPAEAGTGRLLWSWSVEVEPGSGGCATLSPLGLLALHAPFDETCGEGASSEDGAGPAAATLRRSRPGPSFAWSEPVFAVGLSEPLPLPGAGLTVRFGDAPMARTWAVDALVRPTADLADLPAALDALGPDVERELFGADPVADRARWRDLWRGRGPLPYRLGAFLLALARRTAELPRRS